MLDLPSLTQDEICQIQAEKCRRSLLYFIETFWHVVEPSNPFTPGIHIEAMVSHLTHLEEFKNLLICCPPRHSKSLIVSVFFMVWSWLQNPTLRFLYASYATDLSVRDSRHCRNLIDSDLFQSYFTNDFQLTSDQNTKSWFENNRGGVRLAIGYEGGATGKGADRLICLPYNSLISTDQGELPIGDIVEQNLKVRVACVDHKSGQVCWRNVVRTYRTRGEGRRIVKVKTTTGEISLTDNHPIFIINKGYVPAGRVVVNDNIYNRNLARATVLSVQAIEPVDIVYNLEVEEHQNYFADNLLVHNCDDCHNIQEVESRAQRQAVVRWYNIVYANRLNNPATGCRVVVMQRCHPEDVAGSLMDDDAWTRLILPLEAGKARHTSSYWVDPREPGELLCPARLPAKEVAFFKKRLGSRAFNTQYNQNPAHSEDALFKADNFKYYTDPPEALYRIAAVDLALSTDGDYTVIVVADVTSEGDIYLVHLLRQRMRSPKLVPSIEEVYKLYKPMLVYIEDAGFQRAIIDECRMRRIPARGVRPEGDKEGRSITLQVKVENGQLYLLKDAPWLTVLKEELEDFPNGAHDDITDAISYLAIEAHKLSRRPTSRGEAKEDVTPEEKHKRWMQQALVSGIR